MKTTCSLAIALALLWNLAGSPVAAKDDPLDFLHLLQREGYYDVAINYLDELKADPNPPKEVMELWDLEMSRSKNGAVKLKQFYGAEQGKEWADEAKALLEKFVKKNPDRPESIQESARLAQERAEEASYLVLESNYLTDKAEKATTLAKARKTFQEIRPQFIDAVKASTKLWHSLPRGRGRDRASVKWENARVDVGIARLTVAMVDFYMAQTQEAGAERTAALQNSIKEFDAIFQDYRDAFPGWKAHFFNGRILQELGQFQDAKDIYEEVLACDPANISDLTGEKSTNRIRDSRPTGLEGFFADVEQYFLQTLYHLSKKDYLDEIKTWRPAHELNSKNCYGYQALTFEYAKNCLEMGKEAKTKALQDAFKDQALKLLAEGSKVYSPYQQDFIKLRRELKPNATGEEGFEDALIDAGTAVDKKEWAKAAELFEKALAAKTPKTDAKRLAEVKNALVACYHHMALQQYQDGKIDDSIATAKKALTGGFLDSQNAPALAAFLLGVLDYQYRSAADGAGAEKKAKAELLDRVVKTAKAILQHWAAREEGDSARVVLMRLAQDANDFKEADRIMGEINPNSREYPTALTAMGYAHWRNYRKLIEAEQAKNKNGSIDKDSLAKRDEDLRLALDYVGKAVKVLTGDPPRPADMPMPSNLRDAQLFLADMCRESGDFARAFSLYKPVLDQILKDPNKHFDEAVLRVLEGAGQSALQLHDAQNAALVGTQLMEMGPDNPPVNRAILNFALRLDRERKGLAAEGDSADPTTQSTAEARLRTLTDLEEKFMINLASDKRNALSASSMIWVVMTASNLGTDDAKRAAAALIEKIFDKASSNQAFHDEIAAAHAEARLHSLGASMLAELKQYDKAWDQIRELKNKYPRALDPMVSEAKILTEWASADPSKYKEAINAWNRLREKLERAGAIAGAGKVEPKYEVIYSEAECFYRLAQKNKSKDDGKDFAKTGLDLLMPYVNLDVKIRAPEETYKEISAKYFLLCGKLADYLGLPKPIRPRAVRKTK